MSRAGAFTTCGKKAPDLPTLPSHPRCVMCFIIHGRAPAPPGVMSIFRIPGGSVDKEFCFSAGDTGDAGLIPGSGRSFGEGNGSPLQYSCLKNPTYRGAWRSAVYGVAKSQTQLSKKACKQIEGTMKSRGPKWKASCPWPCLKGFMEAPLRNFFLLLSHQS